MIRLELQPEIEAQLATQAQHQDLSAEQLVEQIILSQFPVFPEDERFDRELQKSLDDIAAGNTRPAREVFAELHERYGIRG